MEKYGFVYIWYDRKRKMYYIGCHWGKEDDGYLCSSRRMRDVYRRRPEDFKRRILSKVYTNRQDLLEEEYRWFQYIKPEELGKKYYNLRQHKWGHWSTDIESKKTIKEKLRQANLGKKFSEEIKQKMSLSQSGKKVSKETREKLRLLHLGRTPWNKGIKIGPMSEEQKEKIKQANLGKKPSEETREKLKKARAERKKQPMEGKTHSQETKKLMSISRKNYLKRIGI